MLKNIKIHEVGLRDGLQNEKKVVPTEQKIEWIDILLNSGVDIIQLGSFVHLEKMPQMADTDLLFRHYASIPHTTTLSGLVLNEKGLSRGLDCGVEMFCMGVSASNTHSLKNTGMSSLDASKRIINMAKLVQSEGKKLQVSVQSAFGCGYEGKVPEELVLDIVRQYLDAGLMNISLADTAGHAYPEQVCRLFETVKKADDNSILTAHFHNTYGLGIANCYAAMNAGAEYFETAFGGFGGCPFTKVAAGNVSTEDFVHSINRKGDRTDINLSAIIEVAQKAERLFSKPLQSYVPYSGSVSY
jgi:hydroxymethylglutaryl-CoA lyase